MSDTPSAFPPPPPGGIPPPVYNQVASPVPTYQPPPVAGPPVGYPQGWQQQMWQQQAPPQPGVGAGWGVVGILDRKSTRLNSSPMSISYAVFCLKKKKKKIKRTTNKTENNIQLPTC